MEYKRKAEDNVLVATKKSRHEISIIGTREKAVINAAVPRTSDLYAPIMVLEGHQGEVYAAKFHPEGQHLVSAGFDRQILIWNVFGMCENIMCLRGHSGAVMDVDFCGEGSRLYSAGTDKVVAVWDVGVGVRVRRLRGHSSHVNAVCSAKRRRGVAASVSDDGSARLWDERQREATHVLDCRYPVTAVALSDSADKLYSAGVDNQVSVWDARTQRVAERLVGHADTVTGLALSPDGAYLLSNGAEGALRVWDVRPLAPPERCVKLMSGHRGADGLLPRCAWSADGARVAAGSGDRHVWVWDTATRRALFRLPGHRAPVTAVALHQHQPLLLSGSADRLLYLGELTA